MVRSRYSRVLVLLPWLLWATPGETAEENWYVTDEQSVTLRTGEGNEFRVLRVLNTGTRLVPVRAGETKGWTLVRTDEGVQGWILNRYMTRDMPARLQLEEAVKGRQEAEKELEAVRAQLQSFTGQLVSQKKLSTELEEIRNISKNALAIKQQNDDLQKEIAGVRAEMDALSDRNRQLERQRETQFFLAGAAVLLLGVVLGIMFSRRRKARYGDLIQ